MNEKSPSDIETAAMKADQVLREHLGHYGAMAPHLVVVVAPDGGAIIRSNCTAPVLKAIASGLQDVARDAESQPKH